MFKHFRKDNCNVEHTKDYEMQKKSIRKRIDKIDKTIKSVFENGFNKHDETMMKNIEDWEVERKTLVLEEQEMLKATKTFCPIEPFTKLLQRLSECVFKGKCRAKTKNREDGVFELFL